MHYYGDNWPHWNHLDDAVHLISSYCRRYGRLGGQAKEKYGTVRFYVMFHHQLHDLVWPGHYWLRYRQPYWWRPRWLCYLLGPLFEWFDFEVYMPFFGPLQRCVQRWQAWIYVRAYQKAVKRWPHLKKEIICCADQPQLKGFPK